mgnify:CR=1 FL=1
MAPKPTLTEMVGTLTEKQEAAETRIDNTLTDLTARLKKLEEAASNAPKVPDTAWSALVALVRVAGQDALTVRLLVGGALAAVVVLGLAAMALLNEHPELLGVVNG